MARHPFCSPGNSQCLKTTATRPHHVKSRYSKGSWRTVCSHLAQLTTAQKVQRTMRTAIGPPMANFHASGVATAERCAESTV